MLLGVDSLDVVYVTQELHRFFGVLLLQQPGYGTENVTFWQDCELESCMHEHCYFCNCRTDNYRNNSAHSYNTLSHNAAGTHHAVSYSLVCNLCFCAGAYMLTTRILPLKLTLTLTLTLTANVMRHASSELR